MLEKHSKKRKNKKPRQPSGDQYISSKAAALVFAMFTAVADKETLGRAVKLVQRAPNTTKEGLRALVESRGENLDLLNNQETTTPVSQAEVMELVKPVLKHAVRMTSFAQILDIYLFGKDPVPENIVYACYIITRYSITEEREPTSDESKLIWKIALMLARISKVGGPRWEELESAGAFDLSDWVEPIKENARKRYETFLNQKKRTDAASEDTYKSVMSLFFSDEEETS